MNSAQTRMLLRAQKRIEELEAENELLGEALRTILDITGGSTMWKTQGGKLEAIARIATEALRSPPE